MLLTASGVFVYIGNHCHYACSQHYAKPLLGKV